MTRLPSKGSNHAEVRTTHQVFLITSQCAETQVACPKVPAPLPAQALLVHLSMALWYLAAAAVVVEVVVVAAAARLWSVVDPLVLLRTL
ncbi:hypothetical protein NDU88_013087 [Pleurodeles waltl]|uniref:Uncharacterized protein n=1 Tax=Pleurodeles waltl TaxID=8319 RepID=A0AAV7R3Q7_PLEWA|nr:hypothetical protein NDU88_013087 [Pleurodeles waltl]